MIYGDPSLAAVQISLHQLVRAPYTVLARALRNANLPQDIVLLDCPPSLGLLYANAITSANAVLVPVVLQPWAIGAMDDVLLSITDLLEQEIIRERPHVRALVTMYSGLIDREAKVRDADLRSRENIVVLETKVRHSPKLARLAEHRQTVFEYAPQSAGAADYTAVAQELLA
jgi:chromosome partitioning protein